MGIKDPNYFMKILPLPLLIQLSVNAWEHSACNWIIKRILWVCIWGRMCLATWRRQWHPTPVLLPGKSHGRRSLVGCSPRGHYESDTTERLHFHFHFSVSHIGEGNGNSLQCSCRENPRDGGAWWAAIYGVTQGRTWLKWLSSNSSSSVWPLIVRLAIGSLRIF